MRHTRPAQSPTRGRTSIWSHLLASSSERSRAARRRPGGAGARAHVVPASRFGAPMRPDHRPAWTGQGCHCAHPGEARTVLLTPTRDRTGRYLGCRSRNQEWTSVPEAHTGMRTPDLDHEPSNWTSASRPGDRRGGSTHRFWIHPPHDRPPNRGAIMHFEPLFGSGRPPPRRSWGIRSTGDPTAIEIGLDDARRSHKVGIVVDRSGDPVDVRRLKRRNLAEGVVVKLAERDDRGSGNLERWGRRSPECAKPIANEGTRWRRCPRRLRAGRIVAQWWLSGERRPAPPVSDGLIADTEGTAGIDSPGDRASRLWVRRSATPSRAIWRKGDFVCGVGSVRATAPTLAIRTPGQCRVGVVDLGHTARCGARCRWVIAGQVRMVGPGKTSPGSLDLGRRRVRLDTQDDERVWFDHHPRV